MPSFSYLHTLLIQLSLPFSQDFDKDPEKQTLLDLDRMQVAIAMHLYKTIGLLF